MGSRHVWGHFAPNETPDHCVGSWQSLNEREADTMMQNAKERMEVG
jgi:hypothetical protein